MGKRSILAVALTFVLLLLASSACLAAEKGIEQPTKLEVRIDLGDKYFWTYPYITTEGKILKPTAITLEWTVGSSTKIMRQTLIVPDKIDGEYSVVTERGAIVNLQINVVSADNTVLGGGSLQVRNIGQKEKFYVSLPDTTRPEVTHDTERPK